MTMLWCRFLTFCILVTIILFVVLSCLYGRPVTHLFFHRCCGEDIENDQVIYENFGNNFLRERLVGGEIVETGNDTNYDDEEVKSVMGVIKDVIIVRDPSSRRVLEDHKTEKSVTEDFNKLYENEFTDTETTVTEESVDYKSKKRTHISIKDFSDLENLD